MDQHGMDQQGMDRQGMPMRRATTRAGRSARCAAALACCVLTLAGTGMARAQEAPAPLRMELNRLEPQGESCRAYLLVENTSDDAFKSLRLDLFAFDTDGMIAKRVAVEAGPLPARKTSVKLFDFAGLACERFSRVLLNDVLACEPSVGAKPDCLALVQTGSRVTRIGFVK